MKHHSIKFSGFYTKISSIDLPGLIYNSCNVSTDNYGQTLHAQQQENKNGKICHPELQRILWILLRYSHMNTGVEINQHTVLR